MKQMIQNNSNLFNPEDYYSQKQVADLLNYSVQTVIAKRKLGFINSAQFCPRGRVFINKKEFHEVDMPRLKSQIFHQAL